jgi:hypothetical protein
VAVFSATDNRIEVNSVVLSTFVTKVSFNLSADELETTAMGATWRARIGGLKDGQAQIEFNQDFGAAGPDVTLFSLLGTVVTFKLRPTSGTITTTNPEYQLSVLVSQYNPIDNGVGEKGSFSVTWPTTGTITRATS